MTSLVPGRTRDFQAAPQIHRKHTKKYIVGFHTISLIWIDKDKVENQRSCPLSWAQSQDTRDTTGRKKLTTCKVPV